MSARGGKMPVNVVGPSSRAATPVASVVVPPAARRPEAGRRPQTAPRAREPWRPQPPSPGDSFEASPTIVDPPADMLAAMMALRAEAAVEPVEDEPSSGYERDLFRDDDLPTRHSEAMMAALAAREAELVKPGATLLDDDEADMLLEEELPERAQGSMQTLPSPPTVRARPVGPIPTRPTPPPSTVFVTPSLTGLPVVAIPFDEGAPTKLRPVVTPPLGGPLPFPLAPRHRTGLFAMASGPSPGKRAKLAAGLLVVSLLAGAAVALYELGIAQPLVGGKATSLVGGPPPKAPSSAPAAPGAAR